jgi:hypothetical protein
VDDSVQALAERIRSLEAQLAKLTDAAEAETNTEAEADTERTAPVADRRRLVKLLAASAVGAVAGTVAGGRPAAADDGDSLVLGSEDNTATNSTWLVASDSALVAGSTDGYGIVVDGFYGNMWCFPSGGEPVGFAGEAGTLWVDGRGTWWVSTATGDNAQWRKLAGADTAGSLHLLPFPRRVYDSRPGEPPDVQPKSPLSPNFPRSIDPTANASGVVPMARGALITLTIANPSEAGYATVWSGGTWPGTSNINFAAGQAIATLTVVGFLPGSAFLVQSNVTTDVIVDVVGYYL